MSGPFRPAWWLRNAHLQTLFPTFFRTLPRVSLRRERIELPDGDFLDLDWTEGDRGPIVLVLHGLEGSSRSKYALGLMKAVHARGWRGVVMHFRGCSGEQNRLPRSYHSGETGDPDFIIRLLRQRYPESPLAVIGYSLGGNVLLKWLAEQGEAAPIDAAVAVSVPYRLADSANRLLHGFSRVYQWRLVKNLCDSFRRKRARVPMPIDPALERIRSFWDFDTAVTAPLHGFRDADHYYSTVSSRQYLRHIRKPVLLLHARDDSFMFPRTAPEPTELSPTIQLELSEHGGHVGFIGGLWPWKPHYWLETRIPEYLATQWVT
ncbi:MAG: hydrolase [Pseudomonadota bacterium]